jgi:hypothetical protein
MSHGGGGESRGIPILTGVLKWLQSEDIDYGMPVFITGLLVVVVLLAYVGIPQSKMITFLFLTAPIWLPYLSFHLFFEKWMEMVGKQFLFKGGRTIYEIKLPQDVFKSPEAMEFVFTQIFNKASPDNLMETYLDGKRPVYYSAELVSRGGDVHFYFTITNKFKYGFIDNIYAQYPGVEIRELDLDYTAEIPHDLHGVSMMSFIFNKKKDEEFPIKTYVDFEMTKLPKEEEKVDPMTPMLEMLAGIKPQQQVWVQFLFKAHRDKNFKNGQLHAEGTWETRVEAKIDQIMKRGDFAEHKDEEKTTLDLGAARLTTFEKDKVDAMQRNASKEPYECVIRVIYLSMKERDYDGGLYSRIIRTFAQTEMKGRNGIGLKWRTDFNYNFISDPFNKIRPALKREEMHHYKARNWHGATAIFTAEELATLFHLPGKVAITPTLNRVPSTRGEAPSNLPVGTPQL